MIDSLVNSLTSQLANYEPIKQKNNIRVCYISLKVPMFRIYLYILKQKILVTVFFTKPDSHFTLLVLGSLVYFKACGNN
jgi:hypothetical protein